MTDSFNIPADAFGEPSAPTTSFDDEWASARNEMPIDLARSGVSAAAARIVQSWIRDRFAADVPLEILNGTYRHVLVPPDPAYLYVRDDPMEIEAKRLRFCMRFGLATIYLSGSGKVSYHPLPCHSFTHDGCGPSRCRLIYRRMSTVWEDVETVFLYRIDAATLADLATRIGTRDSDRGRAVNAVCKAGGLQLTIINGEEGDYHAHIFSTVDFSCRKWGDHPARHCDAMPTGHALAHVDQLLRAGIVDRDASRGVRLPDRGSPDRETSTGISLGAVSDRQQKRIRVKMRQLYEASGGEDWPSDDEGWPATWNDDDGRRYGDEAVTAIRAEDQAEADARAELEDVGGG